MAAPITTNVTLSDAVRLVAFDADGAREIAGTQIKTALDIGTVPLLDMDKGRPAVRVVAEANITLSGEQTISGVACVAGDRVLPIAQTDATKNRPHVVVAGGAWTPAGDSLAQGAWWLALEGTNGPRLWVLTTADPITPGTTELTVVAVHVAQAHAATHAAGGSDAVTLTQAQVTGLVDALAAKAAASHTHAGVYQPVDTALTALAGLNDTPVGTGADQVSAGNHSHAGYATASFATIVWGTDTIVADSASDTLTVAAGANITLSGTPGTDTVTITGAAGGGGSHPTDHSDRQVTATGTGAAARTLAARASDWVNVRDYGAAGDGTTNDRAAFVAALAAVPTNGTLYVPAGTYLIGAGTTLTITGGRSVIGDHATIDWRGTGFAFTLDNTRGSVVRGLHFEVEAATAQTIAGLDAPNSFKGGVWFRPATGSVVFSTVEHCDVHGQTNPVEPTIQTRGVLLTGSEGAAAACYYNQIRRNDFSGVYYPVDKRVFPAGDRWTKQPNANAIRHNFFEWYERGVSLGGASTGAYYRWIDECWIEGNQYALARTANSPAIYTRADAIEVTEGSPPVTTVYKQTYLYIKDWVENGAVGIQVENAQHLRNSHIEFQPANCLQPIITDYSEGGLGNAVPPSNKVRFQHLEYTWPGTLTAANINGKGATNPTAAETLLARNEFVQLTVAAPTTLKFFNAGDGKGFPSQQNARHVWFGNGDVTIKDASAIAAEDPGKPETPAGYADWGYASLKFRTPGGVDYVPAGGETVMIIPIAGAAHVVPMLDWSKRAISRTMADQYALAAAKTVAAENDRLLIEDSAASYVKKYMQAGALYAGRQSEPISASAMVPATTNGAATAKIETTTNRVVVEVLDFDAATEEHAWFTWAAPKRWDRGTVSFEALWLSSATDTSAVVWALAGVAIGDNETLDVALGTAGEVSDAAQSNANEIYRSPESAAITIAGSPAAGDLVAFRVSRKAVAGGDTMTVDARLVGIRLFWTANAANDA